MRKLIENIKNIELFQEERNELRLKAKECSGIAIGI